MKILLVDGDADMRALMEFAVCYAGHTSYTAHDSITALRAFGDVAPDLVLLDIGMQQFDGIELCRELRRRSAVAILTLGIRDHEDDLVNAIDAGADDFICKPFSPRVLLARIKALLRRSDAHDPDTVSAGRVRLSLHDRTLHVGSLGPIRLTPLEVTALRLLISTPGKTVPTSRLLAQLWGESSARQQRTLKQIVYRLRKKLEIDPSEPRLIVTIPSTGYKLMTD